MPQEARIRKPITRRRRSIYRPIESLLSAARISRAVCARVPESVAALHRTAQVHMQHPQPARSRRDVILRRINGPEMRNINAVVFARHASREFFRNGGERTSE